MTTVTVKLTRNTYIEGSPDNFIIEEHPWDLGLVTSNGSTLIKAMIQFMDEYFEKHGETVDLEIIEQ